MDKNEKIFAAVDVGSTKIVALAGTKDEDGKIRIIGLGHSASRGVKRGVVLNVEEAFAAISDAIGQAEHSCGHDIENVFVNISGQQLITKTSKQQRTLGRDNCVSEADVEAMLEQARQISLEDGMMIYHVNPEFFTVDNEPGITNPVGVIGERIEATYKVHVAPESYQRNVAMCFNRGSINVQRAVLDPIASSEVVLTEEEKETGVALVDIGGGTTKISIFHEGVLCHTSMIPFGGNVITNDIKEGCAITIRQAESLKVQFGQAIADFAAEDKVVTIPVQGWDPKHISFKSLAHIIQARMEEIVLQFFYQIRKSGYADKLGSGIVLTGGTSLLPNLGQLVKFHTGFDVRVGKPNLMHFASERNLEDPRFSTVLGLLRMAADEGGHKSRRGRRSKGNKSNEPGIIESMKVKISQGKGKIGQIVIGFFEDNPSDMEMT